MKFLPSFFYLLLPLLLTLFSGSPCHVLTRYPTSWRQQPRAFRKYFAYLLAVFLRHVRLARSPIHAHKGPRNSTTWGKCPSGRERGETFVSTSWERKLYKLLSSNLLLLSFYLFKICSETSFLIFDRNLRYFLPPPLLFSNETRRVYRSLSLLREIRVERS